MTWTYEGDPGVSTAAQRRDAVRTLIGDTVSGADVTLSDEQIAFYLTSYPATTMLAVYLAASDAATGLGAGWARQADSVAIGKTRIEYRESAARFTTLSGELRRRAARGVNALRFEGISVADNAARAENTGTVQPKAYEGRDAYPGTAPPLSTQTQEGV